MTKLNSIAVVFLSIFLGLDAVCSAQQLAAGAKDAVFIGKINVKDSVGQSAKKQGKDLELKMMIDALDSQFITAVSATRVFEVVDRNRLTDIQQEQMFSQSGMVDVNDKNTAKFGMIAGAKYAFLAQVDNFEDRMAVLKSKLVDTSVSQRKVDLSIIVQVINTTTGKMLPDVPSVQITKTVAGADAESSRVFSDLAREVSAKLAQKVVALLKPAKVLAVTGKQVLINRGGEAGFVVGAQVGFYAVQEIKDPDTGEVFRNELPIGEGKVVRSDDKKSFAMIVGDDMGIAQGCVVSLVPTEVESAPAVTPTASKLNGVW